MDNTSTRIGGVIIDAFDATDASHILTMSGPRSRPWDCPSEMDVTFDGLSFHFEVEGDPDGNIFSGSVVIDGVRWSASWAGSFHDGTIPVAEAD